VKILITGAAGFTGRYVVEAALARGHRVRALYRAESDPSRLGWSRNTELEPVRMDLREPAGLEAILADVDVVIHLAAVLRGNLESHRRGTIAPTESLLSAMAAASCRRLVLVSSLSVYDYRRIPAFAELDESSPIEALPEMREPYCWAKLRQEELARRHAESEGLIVTTVRPGPIIGPGRIWFDQLGLRIAGSLWARFTAGGTPVPLTYVENCAEAIVLASERTEAQGGTFNIVDDDLPTRRAYVAALRERLARRPLVLIVPGAALRSLARVLAPARGLLGRVPWFLDAARVDTQLKPLRFSHARITHALGWRPRYSLGEALDRSVGSA